MEEEGCTEEEEEDCKREEEEECKQQQEEDSSSWRSQLYTFFSQNFVHTRTPNLASTYTELGLHGAAR